MPMSISGLSDEAYYIFGINQGRKWSLSLVINQKRQYLSKLDFAFFSDEIQPVNNKYCLFCAFMVLFN